MRKYLAQAIAFSIYALFSITWFIVSINSTELMSELNINAQEGVLITNSIVFAKIFGSLFAGFLFVKFGLKIGYFLGCFFISANILSNFAADFSFIDPFYLVVISRFFAGLGSAVALAALVPIANKYFANSKNLGLMITINMNSNLVGSLIAFAFSKEIISFLGDWRHALAFFGYLNLILIFLWLFVDEKDKDMPNSSKKDNSALFLALKNKILWIMVIFYAGPLLFLNASGLHVVMYIKSVLVNQNIISSSEAANLTTNFLSIMTIISVISPFIGNYLKKIGVSRKIIFSLCSCVLAVLSLMYLIKIKEIFYFIAVFGGLFFGLIIPYLFSMPNEKCPKELASVIISLFWSFSFAILFINNQFIAYLYDKFHNFNYAFAYIAALLLITQISILGVKNENK